MYECSFAVIADADVRSVTCLY